MSHKSGTSIRYQDVITHTIFSIFSHDLPLIAYSTYLTLPGLYDVCSILKQISTLDPHTQPSDLITLISVNSEVYGGLECSFLHIATDHITRFALNRDPLSLCKFNLLPAYFHFIVMRHPGLLLLFSSCCRDFFPFLILALIIQAIFSFFHDAIQ